MLLERILRELAVFVVGKRAARSADNAGRLAELTFDLAMIKGRKELALGKVAAAAEDDIIKRFNGNDLAAHEVFSQSGWLRPFNLIDLKKPVCDAINLPAPGFRANCPERKSRNRLKTCRVAQTTTKPGKAVVRALSHHREMPEYRVT